MKFIPSALLSLTLLSSPSWAQNDSPSKRAKDIVLDFREAKDAPAKPDQEKGITSLAQQKSLLEARIKAHEKFIQHMRKMNEKMLLADQSVTDEQEKMKRKILEKIDNITEQNPAITVTRESNEAALLRLEKIGEQMKDALHEVEKMIKKEGK